MLQLRKCGHKLDLGSSRMLSSMFVTWHLVLFANSHVYVNG